MESAEVALYIAILHVSGGAERGWLMLFGVPNASSVVAPSADISSAMSSIRSGCACRDVLGQEVPVVMF